MKEVYVNLQPAYSQSMHHILKTKTIGLLLLAVLFIACTHSQQPGLQQVPEDYGYVLEPGQKIPDFKMILTDGTQISSSEFKGKVVMLQFTASWCGVCRREMPHIENEIRQKYKDRNDFILIGIDLDEPLETVRKFAADMNITYPLALDPGVKFFINLLPKERA